MGNSTKPRKKYIPRRRSADTIDVAISGAALFMPSQVHAITQRQEAAYVLLCQGRAHNHDWNEITQSFSVASELCNLNIGNNLRPAIEAGLTAMSAIAVRMIKAEGPTTCYAEELKAVREALDMYRIQVELCTQAEYQRAVQRVKNFLASLPEETVEDYMARCEKERARSAAVSQ